MKYSKIGVFVLALGLYQDAIAEVSVSLDAQIGSADQESSASGFPTVSGKDTSYGFRLGIDINRYIGFEFGYHNYGEATDSYIDFWGDTITDTMETTSINFGLKGMAPVSDDFSFVGRLGIGLWDYEISETDSFYPGQVFKSDDDGNDFYYGIGAEYLINDNLFVGVEYLKLDIDVDLEGVLDVDHSVENLAVYLGYHF